MNSVTVGRECDRVPGFTLKSCKTSLLMEARDKFTIQNCLQFRAPDPPVIFGMSVARRERKPKAIIRRHRLERVERILIVFPARIVGSVPAYLPVPLKVWADFVVAAMCACRGQQGIVIQSRQLRQKPCVPEEFSRDEQGPRFTVINHVSGVIVVQVLWNMVTLCYLKVKQAIVVADLQALRRLLVRLRSPFARLELIEDWEKGGGNCSRLVRCIKRCERVSKGVDFGLVCLVHPGSKEYHPIAIAVGDRVRQD